ncbi:MAG: MGMT family protein [Candidatus Berkelbacteria bacterium]|nr:MGMT family protein [Candidatus Berkelbacteria bacterium]MCR4307284.1 MGMT family protein [Candidatus Berkelbacteria bacterium]
MSFKEQVIKKIKEIPSGKVATYGQIAALAGSPRGALMVGRTLRYASENEKLPWQRVINSKGRISIVNMSYPAELQAQLLQEEGVVVEKRIDSYYINLSRFLWRI